MELLNDFQMAKKCLEIINKHSDEHEIMNVEIFDLSKLKLYYNRTDNDGQFLGYDLAYLGGDYYSAINNGLFIRPNDSLTRYYSYLNKNGLFDELSLATNYLNDFKKVTPSERNSYFYFYRLTYP